MNYHINPDVPSFLKEQFNQGLLSEEEFDRNAEKALSELEALRYNQSEEAMEYEQFGKEVEEIRKEASCLKVG